MVQVLVTALLAASAGMVALTGYQNARWASWPCERIAAQGVAFVADVAGPPAGAAGADSVRWAKATERFAACPTAATRALADALYAPEPLVRENAALLLETPRPPTAGRPALNTTPATPALLYALTDPEPLVRARAGRALVVADPFAEQSLPTLVALLGDDRADVRAAAAYALRAYGQAARSAGPALRRLASDPTVPESLRADARDALHAVTAGHPPPPTSGAPAPAPRPAALR